MALSTWQYHWITTGSGEGWTLAQLSSSWLVRPITTILHSYPTELAVSLAVVGLTAFIFALRAYFADGEPDAPIITVAPPVTPVHVHRRAIEAALVDMQAQASQQIDAAEHALNRLLADCGGIAKLPIEPTLVPERELKAAPPAPKQQSLAA